MANGIVVEPLALEAVTADSSAAGTTPAALGDDMIGVVHRGTATPTAWIEVDLGTAKSVDFLAFLATEGAATGQRIRAATTQGGLTAAPGLDSGVVGFTAGSAGGAFERVHSWWEAAAPASFRWWRIDLSGLSSPFAAGRLVLGRRTAFARNFSFGLAPGIKDTGRARLADSGALDRREGARARTLSIQWASLSKAEIEGTLHPILERIGRTGPLLIVTDPAADAQRARRMYFGVLDEDIETPQRRFDQWEWRTRLLSFV